MRKPVDKLTTHGVNSWELVTYERVGDEGRFAYERTVDGKLERVEVTRSQK